MKKYFFDLRQYIIAGKILPSSGILILDIVADILTMEGHRSLL